MQSSTGFVMGTDAVRKSGRDQGNVSRPHYGAGGLHADLPLADSQGICKNAVTEVGISRCKDDRGREKEDYVAT